MKKLSPRIDKLTKEIENFVGKNSKAFRNKHGDLIIESKDGLKHFRIDLNNPHPHTNQPHSHLIEFRNIRGSKYKEFDIRIFAKDVVQE